ncbi:hypothetical protein [Jiangella muralis]|uniref:hypothetical protein n=1 Tax=Jiangella muralis TaxID=702383 RepID=UPI00069EC2FF|nr:hypothetical protein [Jiangella muralis]
MTATRHGFWEYTTPGCGGAEFYTLDDWRTLIADMSEHGMDDLLLMVKWWTTGYRSRLDFLDQDPDNAAIASDNELIHAIIDLAHAAGLKVTLGAVLSFYVRDRFPFGEPHTVVDECGGFGLGTDVGVYTLTDPRVLDAGLQVAAELCQLFPQADGMMFELESSGQYTDESAARFETWARAKGVGTTRVLHARNFDFPAWRDFVTDLRIAFLTKLEDVCRANDFHGRLSTIAETANEKYLVQHELNLDRLLADTPGWQVICYDYWRWQHRLAGTDLCIVQPKSVGLSSAFLARGLMTYPHEGGWPLPIPLTESWDIDVEDLHRHQPDQAWWFGAGPVREGPSTNVELARLRESGFASGRDARLDLLRRIRGASATTR